MQLYYCSFVRTWKWIFGVGATYFGLLTVTYESWLLNLGATMLYAYRSARILRKTYFLPLFPVVLEHPGRVTLDRTWEWGYTIYLTNSCITSSLDSDWLRAGQRRSRSSSPGRVKNFLYSASSRPALGPTQPPIKWVPRAPSPGVKRQGREADHSPPTSAEVKEMLISTSTPPYVFMA
jgi:hypothetical protein